MASASAKSTCYIQLDTFDKSDVSCKREPINTDKAFFTINMCEWSDNVAAYVRVPFCQEDIGVSVYLYEDL
mgnify:CR=1 FL=1